MTGALSGDGDRAWQEALDWLFEMERRPGDPQAAAALERWLAADPANARAYAEARLIWDGARQMKPQASFPPSVMPSRAKTARPSRRPMLSMIAASIAALAISVGAFNWTDLRADHVSAVGELRPVSLPDGSRLVLDTNSAVDIAFVPGERRVALLRGAAHFAVATEPARRFVVAAGSARVTVTGTRFDVRREGRSLTVSVEEGAVAVDAAPEGAGRIELAAGDRLRLDLASGAVRRDRLPPHRMAAWRQGQLVVSQQTVGTVLGEIARYYGGRLVLADDALSARRVSGVYDLAHPISAMRAVIAPFGGRLRAFTPWLVTVSAR